MYAASVNDLLTWDLLIINENYQLKKLTGRGEKVPRYFYFYIKELPHDVA